MEYKIIDFPVHGDHEGKLVALEKMLIFHLKLSESIIFGIQCMMP